MRYAHKIFFVWVQGLLSMYPLFYASPPTARYAPALPAPSKPRNPSMVVVWLIGAIALIDGQEQWTRRLTPPP